VATSGFSGAHVDAQIAREMADGLDLFARHRRRSGWSAAVPAGRSLRGEVGVGLALDGGAQHGQVRGLGVALDGVERRGAGDGVGVGSIGTAQGPRRSCRDAAIGSELIVVVIGHDAESVVGLDLHAGLGLGVVHTAAQLFQSDTSTADSGRKSVQASPGTSVGLADDVELAVGL
jgi:hypothetical protein